MMILNKTTLLSYKNTGPIHTRVSEKIFKLFWKTFYDPAVGVLTIPDSLMTGFIKF